MADRPPKLGQLRSPKKPNRSVWSWRSQSTRGKVAIITLVALAVVAVSAILPNTGDDDSGRNAASANSPDENLAIIELGHRPDSDSSILLRITYLLDRMQEECPTSTRTQLADYTANVMLELEKVGVEAQPREILTDVRQSSSLRAFKDCLDLFTFYTILRKEQG